MSRDRVAFLFLGETLLIPHLWPIVAALAAEKPDLRIDLWVSTSLHEALLSAWVHELPGGHIRIRRAPGYRRVADTAGRNPDLPAKLPMLLRLAPYLWRTPVIVCAEQTSLWLPTLLPIPARFVKTSHGVGSMSARDDRRRRAAALTLVPSDRERDTYLARGMPPERIIATGYVKASFARTAFTPHFATDRPTILYNPHWQRHRSSWWRWGRDVIGRILNHGRWNLIFAPHQRLVEGVPDLRDFCAALAGRGDVHCDLDSFAAVDGSHTAAADLYLGDTSSQMLEFVARPRPAVFLNAHGVDWRDDPSYAMWVCGDVVAAIDDVLPALERAPSRHAAYAAEQAAFAHASLGDTGGAAPGNAARAILSALQR